VSMGNPHCVVVVDELTDALVCGIGPGLETHPFFPARTNVEFVRVADRRTIEMRVWERGSGETLACGTGACAAAVACALSGLTEHRVTVRLKGGALAIEWTDDDHVSMTGPATHVFDGEVEVGGAGRSAKEGHGRRRGPTTDRSGPCLTSCKNR